MRMESEEKTIFNYLKIKLLKLYEQVFRNNAQGSD